MRGIEFKKLMRRTSLLPPGLGVVFSPIPWVDELRLRPVDGVLASRIAPIEGFSATL
jgi:hypothetical protein